MAGPRINRQNIFRDSANMSSGSSTDAPCWAAGQGVAARRRWPPRPAWASQGAGRLPAQVLSGEAITLRIGKGM
jgi:hypothetical protein